MGINVNQYGKVMTQQNEIVHVFKPENYGAAKIYNSNVDDTTYVQQAIDAAVAVNGQVWLSRVYQITNGGLTVSGTITISGIGGRLMSINQGGTFPGIAQCGFYCPSTTDGCLAVNAAGINLNDFAVINTSSTLPTSGVGIKLNSSHNHALDRITIQGFYNNIQIEGRFGTIDSCHFYDPVNYGMYFLTDNAGEGDFGDQGVTNCVIAMLGRTTNAAAAVRWESGGGIRWANNKIVAGTGPGASSIGVFSYGLDIMVMDGVSTVEFMVSGGGISTCSTACVRIGQGGPLYSGNMNDIIFQGVVFQGYGSSAIGIIVGASDTAHFNEIKRIYIGGCTFKGILGGGILAGNVKNVCVDTNIWDNAAYTAPLITLAGGNDNGIGTPGATVNTQCLGELTGIDLIKDNRKLSNAKSQSGEVNHGFTSQMYANVVGTWVTLGYFDMLPTEGGAFVIDVEFDGYDYGVGPIYARYRRLVTRTNPSGTVTLTTLGSDETGGTGTHYAVQFVTTTANRVIIQYQLTTGGVTVWGRAKMRPSGQIALSHIGA